MPARIAAVTTVTLVLLCAGCASLSAEQDADWHPDKIYRTGSNIPTKDYGAANIEVGKSEVMTPMNRPATGTMMRKPGN